MKFLSMLLLFAISSVALPLMAVEDIATSELNDLDKSAVERPQVESELAADINSALATDLELSNGLSGVEIQKYHETLLAKVEPSRAPTDDSKEISVEKSNEKSAERSADAQVDELTAGASEADQALIVPTPIKTSDSSENPFYRLIFLGVFGLFAAIAGYLYLRKKQRQMGVKASDIKILSQTYLGPKKSVAILRVAGESILIGITDSNINLIKSLSLLDEEIPSETPKKFNSIFKGAAEDETDDGAGDSYNQRALLDEEEDAFEYNGLQGAVVNKIKRLKEIGSR